MTDQQAEQIHQAVIDLAKLTGQYPAAATLHLITQVVHTAMHLGEPGLITLLEYASNWVENCGRPLAIQAGLVTREPEPQQDQPQPGKPEIIELTPAELIQVLRHTQQVDELAQRIRNGEYPTNPE